MAQGCTRDDMRRDDQVAGDDHAVDRMGSIMLAGSMRGRATN